MKIELDILVSKLAGRLLEELPGPLAHDVLRATPVGNYKFDFGHKSAPRPGSVLILFYAEEGIIKFPLIQRPNYQGAHSGQISLPGGKAEIGEDRIQTALRECEEEVGVVQSAVRIVGGLSEFFVIPSNFLITPVVGYVESKPDWKPDPKEVEGIVIGSLDQLLPNNSIKSKEIVAAGRYPMIAPHFEFDGQIVWGATAMMLNELRVVIRECFPEIQ